MTYRFRVAPGAEAQIRQAADWWIENRPKAPQAFARSGESFPDHFLATRNRGACFHPQLKGIRRLLMGRVRYHLYYQIDEEQEIVEVLALWHTSRGTTPALSPDATSRDLEPDE